MPARKEIISKLLCRNAQIWVKSLSFRALASSSLHSFPWNSNEQFLCRKMWFTIFNISIYFLCSFIKWTNVSWSVSTVLRKAGRHTKLQGGNLADWIDRFEELIGIARALQMEASVKGGSGESCRDWRFADFWGVGVMVWNFDTFESTVCGANIDNLK